MLPGIEAIDLDTAGVLAAAVLLDGLRRIPAGAALVRWLPGTGWRVVEVDARPRVSLVSWWAPLTLTLVISPAAPSAAQVDVTTRWARVRWWLVMLRCLGGLTLVALVVGLPWAVGAFGGPGFLASLGVVLLFAAATALTGRAAVARVNGAGPGWRRVLGWCSPFAAVRAAEDAAEAVLRGVPPIGVLRELLSPDAFAAWARPRAYDMIVGGESDPELEATVGRVALETLIASVPPDVAAGAALAYCRRCGAGWQVMGECPECAVALCASAPLSPATAD